MKSLAVAYSAKRAARKSKFLSNEDKSSEMDSKPSPMLDNPHEGQGLVKRAIDKARKSKMRK